MSREQEACLVWVPRAGGSPPLCKCSRAGVSNQGLCLLMSRFTCKCWVTCDECKQVDRNCTDAPAAEPRPGKFFPRMRFLPTVFLFAIVQTRLLRRGLEKTKVRIRLGFSDFLGGSALKSNLRRRGRKKKKKTSLPSGVT